MVKDEEKVRSRNEVRIQDKDKDEDLVRSSKLSSDNVGILKEEISGDDDVEDEDPTAAGAARNAARSLFRKGLKKSTKTSLKKGLKRTIKIGHQVHVGSVPKPVSSLTTKSAQKVMHSKRVALKQSKSSSFIRKTKALDQTKSATKSATSHLRHPRHINPSTGKSVPLRQARVRNNKIGNKAAFEKLSSTTDNVSKIYDLYQESTNVINSGTNENEGHLKKSTEGGEKKNEAKLKNKIKNDTLTSKEVITRSKRTNGNEVKTKFGYFGGFNITSLQIFQIVPSMIKSALLGGIVFNVYEDTIQAIEKKKISIAGGK